MSSSSQNKWLCWVALALLVVPMFGSFFFDDMFSAISHFFESPSSTALGWGPEAYGLYTSGYSTLCVFGGLVFCGILLDKWGIRVTGSIFVTMMLVGAAVVLYAITAGLDPSVSVKISYIGCMFFGLGSEIAGTAVTRAIAKWFKHGHMALAMGLQLSIARLGTAFALVLSPKLVAGASEPYPLAVTARPAYVGVGLIALGLILWAVFVALDARYDRNQSISSANSTPSEEDQFRLSDILKVLTNKNFLLIGLLCVLFYSSIVAFKKFAGAILVPRFDIPSSTAGWMVSMLPFACVIFSPVFGLLVDEKGKGTKWMLLGALLAFVAHIMLCFAPSGVPFYGYLSMVFLGFGYSLVPAALWPSIPKILPEKVLGTAYALTYWIQNLGLMTFKMLAGFIIGGATGVGVTIATKQTAAFRVELMFVVLCIATIAVAFLLSRESKRHPELRLDEPNK